MSMAFFHNSNVFKAILSSICSIVTILRPFYIPSIHPSTTIHKLAAFLKRGQATAGSKPLWEAEAEKSESHGWCCLHSLLCFDGSKMEGNEEEWREARSRVELGINRIASAQQSEQKGSWRCCAECWMVGWPFALLNQPSFSSPAVSLPFLLLNW